jgi:hypothetical protein
MIFSSAIKISLPFNNAAVTLSKNREHSLKLINKVKIVNPI